MAAAASSTLAQSGGARRTRWCEAVKVDVSSASATVPRAMEACGRHDTQVI